MSEQRKVKTRIQNKYDTPENWSKAKNFVPLKGELIISDVYTDIYETNGADETVRKVTAQPIKVGDGFTSLSGLPYINKRNAMFITIPEYDSVLMFPEDITYTSTLEKGNLDITYCTSNAHLDVVGVIEAGVETTQKLRVVLTDAANIRDYNITLNLTGAGSENRDTNAGNFHINDVRVYMKPAKCLFDSWTVSDDTVINNSTNKPIQTYRNTTSDSSTTYVSYAIHMPEDVDPQDEYVYKNAMLEISFTATPVSVYEDSKILLLTIENELYLSY